MLLKQMRTTDLILHLHLSKLDIHAVHYCLAISTKSNQRSLCEAITQSTKPNEMPKHLCFQSSLDHLYHKKFGNSMKIGMNDAKQHQFWSGLQNDVKLM